MHAILRIKTLLGETYVQLNPQPGRAPAARQRPPRRRQRRTDRDARRHPREPQPADTQIFQVWQQSVAAGIHGRGEQINSDFAALEPFVEHTNRLLAILASQEGALREVVHGTGVVFNALASRDHQLEGLIVNGEHTFHAASEASEAFAQAFRELPPFEHNSKVALEATDKFATVANPYFEEFAGPSASCRRR